jgi:hypothetical protein
MKKRGILREGILSGRHRKRKELSFFYIYYILKVILEIKTRGINKEEY